MEDEIEQIDGYNVLLLDQDQYRKIYLGRKINERILIKIFKTSSSDQINSLRRKALMVQRLSHKNIISLLEFREQLRCSYEDGSIKEMIGMKTEYAELGSLVYYEKPFSEEVCRYFFIQLLYGLKYLVDNRICHLDIKPANLVLNSEYILKIIDFGLVCENQDLLINCGTKSYKAPEVEIQGRLYDGEKVDVFAAGVTLLELYTGLSLQGADNDQSKSKIQSIFKRQNDLFFLNRQYDQFWKDMRQQTNINFSNDFMSLINGMLNPNPHKRFTVQQCQSHEWVKGPTPLPQRVSQELKNKYQQRNRSQLLDGRNIIKMKSDNKEKKQNKKVVIKEKDSANLDSNKLKNLLLKNGVPPLGPITSSSDCEIFAARRILKLVSEGEIDDAILLSPQQDSAKNNYGIYYPDVNKSLIIQQPDFKKLIINPRLMQKSVRKSIAKQNLSFLFNYVQLYDMELRNIEKMTVINENKIEVIPYYIMVKANLSITKFYNIPINLKVRQFKIETNQLVYEDASILYTVREGQYKFCSLNTSIDPNKEVVYEAVAFDERMNRAIIEDILFTSFGNSKLNLSLIKSTEKNNPEQLVQAIDQAGGIEQCLLYDAAAHKQLTGFGTHSKMTQDQNFQMAYDAINKAVLGEGYRKDCDIVITMQKQRLLAQDIGVCAESPQLFYLTHICAGIDYLEGTSEENQNNIKKQLNTKFENSKIKIDSLENMLNYHIFNLNPEILIIELINKNLINLDFTLEFDEISRKTNSVIFNMRKNSKEIGKIQIDIYKLENNLISVNIIKLEGGFEDYLKAKNALEVLLQTIEKK